MYLYNGYVILDDSDLSSYREHVYKTINRVLNDYRSKLSLGLERKHILKEIGRRLFDYFVHRKLKYEDPETKELVTPHMRDILGETEYKALIPVLNQDIEILRNTS